MSKRRIRQQPQNKSILVTGAKGFLGRYLVSELRKKYSQVRIYQRDVRNISSLSKRYDVVCHLAAFTKISSKADAGLLFDVNVNGTLAVMEYCRKNKARCVFASSAAVYSPTLNKGRLDERSRAKTQILYGISKLLAENICRSYTESFKVPVVALRIFNMYGRGQKPPFLIPSVIEKVLKKRPAVIKTPQVVRDFVNVEDVARAFSLSCAINNNGFVPLNIGTGRGLSVQSLACKIADSANLPLYVDKNSVTDSDKNYAVADIGRAAHIIGWHPLISIEKGLSLILRERLKRRDR